MNKMNKTTMLLKMQGYWAVGSGKGGGYEVDSRIDRDADGLPYVPGKMLKGLIRDACLRLCKAGQSSDYKSIEKIFEGEEESESEEAKKDLKDQKVQGEHKKEASKIFISDARLSPKLRQALIKDPERMGNLTRNIYSTAINDHGTAAKDTLRGYEVAVPMELQSTVECDCTKEVMDFIKLAASKLVYAVGSHKSRGLGEVVIEFKDEA